LIKNLFQTKWEIIYSTQNIEKYAKVKGRLLNNNSTFAVQKSV